MPQINCHIPIKLRLVGMPDATQLEQLGQTLTRSLQERIAFAEHTIASRYNLSSLSAKTELREDFDAARLEIGGSAYQIPSYDQQGRPVSMRLTEPARPKRPWIIRKAINFHAKIGDFLDLVESLMPQQTLESKVLYIDRSEELRWVSLWMVQVNQDYTLVELEAILSERADQLSKHRSDEMIAYGMGTNEQLRRKLIHIDQDGLVARNIPDFVVRNQGRIARIDNDLVVRAGGWLLFASMVLPIVQANDLLVYFPELSIQLPLHMLDFIVNPASFERLFQLSWDSYINQYGDQPATLHILPFNLLKRSHFQALKYLIEPTVAANVDEDSAYFGNLYLLNQERLAWLPDAARKQARTVTNETTLALNESQREGMWEADWHGAFIYAVVNPYAQPASPNNLQAEAKTAAQKQPSETPAQLISRFTSWGNLDEDGLGGYLLSLIRQSPALSAYVERALDELGTKNRDDVSLAFMEQATDADLLSLSQSPSGQILLVRLLDELTSGKMAEDEQKQAQRLMAARIQSRSMELVARRLVNSRGLVFPYRKGGPTVLDDAPLMADRLSDGRIRVKLPVRVRGTEKFRAEVQTLPLDTFLQGIVLDADEWISVKLYDEGGITVQQPALFLLQLSNTGDYDLAMKVLAVSATALSFGAGGAIAGSSRVLIFLDRAALAIGILGTIVDDHRGWIIAKFGENGRTFIKAVGVAEALAGVYGLGRLAFSLPHIIRDLRLSWRNWRTSSAYQELSGTDLRRAEEISQKTEQFLNDIDNAAAEMQKSAPHTGTPAPQTTPAPSSPGAAADDEAGLALFGKKAPAPSGPISDELRVAYLKQLESAWFKTKLRAYAKLTGKGEIDWNELSRMVETAEFREYASAWEAAQSIGYAGINEGRIVLSMAKKMRKIPVLGNSAMQHEIVHVYQEMVAQTISKEASKSLSYGSLLKAEVAAQVFGSPAVILTYTSLIIVIMGGAVYLILR